MEKSAPPLHPHTLRNETTNYIANRNGSEATLIIQPASENVWHGSVRVQPTHSWSAESHFQRGGASATTNIAKFTSTTNAGSMTRVTNTTNICMIQEAGFSRFRKNQNHEMSEKSCFVTKPSEPCKTCISPRKIGDLQNEFQS